MSIDIEDVADELGLRRGGKRGDETLYFDPADGETPDLSINLKKDQWFTFAGGQNTGGGFIDLVCHVKDVNRDQAKEWLSEKFPDRYGNLNEEEIELKKKSREVLEKATALAHSTLMNQRDQIKQGILEKRKFDEEDLKEARIGFLSKDDVATLEGRFDKEELIASGLFLEGKNDSVFCHLKNRIIFPYLNDNHPVFMAGRVLPENEEEADAKYKKTVTTDYNRHILYMFTEGRDDLIITEGFTDTISAQKAGYDVASPATVQFREEDLDKIERICRHYDNVYIINDGDEAGEEGAMKSAKHLSRLGFEPEIVKMEEGKDLDDWTTENGYDITELIKDSESVIDKKIEEYRNCSLGQLEAKKVELFEYLLNWGKSSRKGVFQRMDETLVNQLEYEFAKWKNQELQRQKQKPIQHFVAGEDDFENQGTFLPSLLASDILQDYELKTLIDSGQLYIFKEGYWQQEGTNLVREETRFRLGEHYQPARAGKTVDTLKDQTYIRRGEFQPPNDKVNLSNGTFDLEREELIPHSPGDNFLFKVPYKYDPDASCPEIMDFLDEITHHDKIKRERLLDMLAYTLLPDMPVARALMMVGSGGNGKTIVIELLKQLLGKKGKPYTNKSIQDLEESRFETSDLYGSLAVIDDDLPPTKIEDANTFKKITGGTDQRGEVKFGGRFEFDPYATPIYAANHIPKTEDTTNGFFRRWCIVHLPVDFVENPNPEDHLQKEREKKRELIERLTSDEEMEGLLRNLLHRLHRIVYGEGFKYKRTPDENRDVWRQHNEPVVDLIKNYLQQGVTKAEAENQNPNADDLNYDYIRQDAIYKLAKVHHNEIIGETPSNKEINKKLRDSDLALNVGTRTRQDPDDISNSNGVTRVVSGVKLILPERDSDKAADIPGYFYSIMENEFGESNQSYHVVDPESPDGSIGNRQAIKDHIRENYSDDSIMIDDLVEEIYEDVDEVTYREEQIEDTIERLMSEGVIYEVNPGEISTL